MASGIAQWCAAHGLPVLLCDNNREALQNTGTVIRSLSAKAVKRGQLTEDAARQALGGLSFTNRAGRWARCG